MAYLILVRHGNSEWNALGKWTGLEDVSLSEQGREEARSAAAALEGLEIHGAHTSNLKRAHETLEEIQLALNLSHIPVQKHQALNERDYGKYTGKNKWQIKDEVGEEEFKKIRRSWDYQLPEGESLKDVHARVVPYYKEHILEDLKQGKNIIVAAHGNSLRALVKHLEDISDDDISNLEIGTGDVHLYEINEDAKIISKEIKSSNPNTGKI